MDNELKQQLIKGLDKMPKLILIPLILTGVENSFRICAEGDDESAKIAKSYIKFTKKLADIWSEE